MKDKLGDLILTRREWEKISRSVKEHLREDPTQRVSKVIALSYSKLPSDLRYCFLYFGMFPEDASIPAWKLTLMWIAEGFIQPKEGKSLEEVAMGNLNELINRALVMVQENKLDGDVKTCSVHDAIHEFCKKEADFENQNLFQEIRWNEDQGAFEPKLGNTKDYRRLSIHSYVRSFFSEKRNVLAPRSFVCFPKDPVDLEKADIARVTNAFNNLLRVLHAEKINFPMYPSKLISELLHLRYLTLSFNSGSLPETISNLRNLQTLIVHTTHRTLEIKANIWKMIHLSHLKTKSSITLTRSEKGQSGGENLKTLSKLSPQCCIEGVLTMGKNLHTLDVRGDLTKLLLHPKCMENLNCLNNLKLEHDTFPDVPFEKRLIRLPPSKSFPRKLKVLTLKSTYLEWPQMSTLGKLENLEVLKLKDNAFVGNEWKIADGCFLKLEFLYIERNNVVSWTASDGALRELKCLKLKNCEKLDVVPSVLGTKLQILSLDRVSRTAVASGRKIEEAKKAIRVGFKLNIGPGDKIAKY